MNSEEERHCRVEAARAKETVKDFFEACVPARLRAKFVSCATQHENDSYLQMLRLKAAIDAPSDIPTQDMNCGLYVKESKRLIRAVSFVLLRAFPETTPVVYHWNDLKDLK